MVAGVQTAPAPPPKNPKKTPTMAVAEEGPCAMDMSSDEGPPTSSSRWVRLTSSDGGEVDVRAEEIRLCGLVATMLDEEDEDEQSSVEIPLPACSFIMVQKIARFCAEYHARPFPAIQKPLVAEPDTILSPWYVGFINAMSFDELGELCEAANYVQNEPLVHLMCIAIVAIIRRTPDEELGELLHSTLPAEEQAALREKYKDLLKYK